MNRRQRKRRTRIRRALVVGPLLGVVALYLVGSAMSPVHTEVATRHSSSSPETVWGVLMDLDAMPSWRPELLGLERLPDGGAGGGEGGAVRWLEITPTGRVALERVAAKPPSYLVIEVMGTPSRVRWVYHVLRAESGTTISIAERRRVVNPAMRPFVALFGVDRAPLERLIDGLTVRAGGVRQIATRK